MIPQLLLVYRKIPKINPGAYIRRGVSTEGNLRLKIDWASLIFGRKFTVLALFYFVFEGHEDPHTTSFCTPHDAGGVKDARFCVTSNKPPTAKSN